MAISQPIDNIKQSWKHVDFELDMMISKSVTTGESRIHASPVLQLIRYKYTSDSYNL